MCVNFGSLVPACYPCNVKRPPTPNYRKCLNDKLRASTLPDLIVFLDLASPCNRAVVGMMQLTWLSQVGLPCVLGFLNMRLELDATAFSLSRIISIAPRIGTQVFLLLPFGAVDAHP